MEANIRIIKSIKKLNENINSTQNEQEKIKKQLESTTKDTQKELKELKQDLEKENQKLEQELKEQIKTIELTPGPQGIPGKDGKNGIDGKDGLDGKDGKPGKDGKNGIDGKDGKDGKDGIGIPGAKGKDGQDGIGVKDAKVDNRGNLIITLSNKKTINAGRVVGIGLAGANGRDGIGVEKAEIKDHYLYITLTDGTVINAGYIGGSGPGEEVDPIFTSSPAYNITSEDITSWDNKAETSDIPTNVSELNNDAGYITSYTETDPTVPNYVKEITQNDITAWNNKSDFSGSYNDLTDKPSLFSGDYNDLTNKPTIPTNTSDLNNDSGFIDNTVNNLTNYTLTSNLSSVATSGSYNDLSDTPTLFSGDYNDLTNKPTIPDELADLTDDSTHRLVTDTEKTTWNNKSDFSGSYNDLSDKPTIPEIFYIPISSSNTTTVTWEELYEAYNNGKIILAKIDYMQGITIVPVVEPLYLVVGNQSGGTFMFTFVMGSSSINYMVTGTGNNVCTITKQEKSFEEIANKSQSILTDTGSTTKYTSVKSVEDFVKPVVIWESSTPADYLKGIQADLSASPAWQLTNLDMTPYKRIKIYSCAGRKSSGVGVDASTTPAIVLEMSLDSRNAIAEYGNNYVGSAMVQKPNDANRFATLTCAVSADKTSFVVLRQTNLYGTAATSNNDANANVFMIEGYYD